MDQPCTADAGRTRDGTTHLTATLARLAILLTRRTYTSARRHCSEVWPQAGRKTKTGGEDDNNDLIVSDPGYRVGSLWRKRMWRQSAGLKAVQIALYLSRSLQAIVTYATDKISATRAASVLR